MEIAADDDQGNVEVSPSLLYPDKSLFLNFNEPYRAIAHVNVTQAGARSEVLHCPSQPLGLCTPPLLSDFGPFRPLTPITYFDGRDTYPQKETEGAGAGGLDLEHMCTFANPFFRFFFHVPPKMREAPFGPVKPTPCCRKVKGMVSPGTNVSNSAYILLDLHVGNNSTLNVSHLVLHLNTRPNILAGHPYNLGFDAITPF